MLILSKNLQATKFLQNIRTFLVLICISPPF
jgi:effector-binding domain-containing protein